MYIQDTLKKFCLIMVVTASDSAVVYSLKIGISLATETMKTEIECQLLILLIIQTS